jgi:hypothetical protein
LWKQRRSPEAWEILAQVQTNEPGFVPAPLLRAAVLAEIGRDEDAANELKSFDASKALPEEASLATVLASKVKSDARVSRVN